MSTDWHKWPSIGDPSEHFAKEDRPRQRKIATLEALGFHPRTVRASAKDPFYWTAEAWVQDTSRFYRGVSKNAKERKSGRKRRQKPVQPHPRFRWYET